MTLEQIFTFKKIKLSVRINVIIVVNNFNAKCRNIYLLFYFIFSNLYKFKIISKNLKFIFLRECDHVFVGLNEEVYVYIPIRKRKNIPGTFRLISYLST